MEKTPSEADILNEMVSLDLGSFPPEGARALLALQFTPKAISRMNELAEKNRLAAITSSEREEMDKYMRVGNFLTVLKAKARLSLAKQSPAS